jgi:hypothetical protein
MTGFHTLAHCKLVLLHIIMVRMDSLLFDPLPNHFFIFSIQRVEVEILPLQAKESEEVPNFPSSDDVTCIQIDIKRK